MTEAIAELQELYSGELHLGNYSQLRDLALLNEGNSRQLEAMADAIGDRAGAPQQVKKGIAYWILGRTEKAVRALSKAHPDEELATVFLGKAHLDRNDLDGAREIYKEGLKKHRNSRPILYGLIMTELRRGEYDEAEKLLDRCEKDFGPDVETRFLRGYHAELTGEYYKAKEAYEAVLEQVPVHPQALFRLACWHQTWGEEEEAIRLYETMRGLRPVYANALLNLGNLYEDYQRYDQAIECYKEVLSSIPSHPRALMFLADAEASKTMFYDEEGERRADRQSAILRIPVTDFELTVRSRNCLNKMNIKTLGDLIQMTEQDLLAHKNFGETSLMEVKQMLAQKGLRLGQGKIEGGALRLPPKQVEVSEEVLNQHIDSLNLSVRSRKCMERLGITTLGQLISRTESELLSAKNFGQTSLNEIKSKLEERGLRLKDAAY
ncbi:MAG: tetratricopeptide repeat protein [Planctomycetota bacterium]|nr:MAG: tetratricopeptide repeat protein [Planctomycetota bacterium]